MGQDQKILPEHAEGTGGIKWWHRINLPGTGYTNGLVNYGPDGGDWPTTRFGLPLNLTGKTVLDLGCFDGFFSFEAEKRGATVLAADCSFTDLGFPCPSDGFVYAKKALKSKVTWQYYNLDDAHARQIPSDVVLCYGILYHVLSPLVCMKNLSELTAEDGICLIETAMSTETAVVLEYKPRHENDPTNYFYPTEGWINKAAKEVGFKHVVKVGDFGNRATFKLTK